MSDKLLEADGFKPEAPFKAYEPTVKIVSEEQRFLVGKFPGIAITGFIDVEKFITLHKDTFFIEKKLPFQILIISTIAEPHYKEV
jgi:hypothetical protein